MKKSVFAVLGLSMILGLGACNNASDKIKSDDDKKVSVDNVTTEGTPVFKFEEESYDFGQINEGDQVEHDFEFTNTGDAPLIITSATGSCGCTVPNPPKEPIAPGESSKILVQFNSSGKAGNQQKTVTINANTVPATTMLRISAQVTPKDQSGEAATEGTEGAEG
ncbi:MAG TPA: hypothetical protein DCG19_10285 [Cryomorphaceae bacterium]|nr:hypothetical protein [Owenweeksia sp.]MBF99682.1 hypothetical protein [Owenweeksia sp.]HAD97784.1 hypothetical protein [Cryomorphaceae bacterium]HBF21703.1 hypothetical protein [Cryomorphaceae bacterium]HCQ16002.1 hypothetical protein [Cryomorphaceae bacterium]|tara:strand:+ start:1496 stop:1990 length:495 start_codon:yes stop_codon:yes gene_type:complete